MVSWRKSYFPRKEDAIYWKRCDYPASAALAWRALVPVCARTRARGFQHANVRVVAGRVLQLATFAHIVPRSVVVHISRSRGHPLLLSSIGLLRFPPVCYSIARVGGWWSESSAARPQTLQHECDRLLPSSFTPPLAVEASEVPKGRICARTCKTLECREAILWRRTQYHDYCLLHAPHCIASMIKQTRSS